VSDEFEELLREAAQETDPAGWVGGRCIPSFDTEVLARYHEIADAWDRLPPWRRLWHRLNGTTLTFPGSIAKWPADERELPADEELIEMLREAAQNTDPAHWLLPKESPEAMARVIDVFDAWATVPLWRRLLQHLVWPHVVPASISGALRHKLGMLLRIRRR
jgi:hypothetical protein